MRVCTAHQAGVEFWSSRTARGLGLAASLFIVSLGIQPAHALGDTRTIAFQHVHTGEKLTVTYKKNGHYDDAALKKINWIMRDWRKEQDITMDPQAIDLLWEVYQEVRATEPIQIICGYRSPDTNNMLRRRSKGVAKFSQHTLGKAIDFYIPGVPLENVRAAAMKMQGGGVGYYPASGSPFVHLDIGSVRAWPRMTREQLVKLFPNGRTVHVPADGTPLPGYELAQADLERGVNANRSAATPKPRSLLAALFGGQDAEETNDAAADQQRPPTPSRRPIQTAMAAPATPAPVAAPSAPEPIAVPLPRSRPTFQIASAPVAAPAPTFQMASADSRPAPVPTARPIAAPVNIAALSANDIINSRGFWGDASEPVPAAAATAPTSVSAARRVKDNSRTASAEGDLARATGPFARPDRVPPEVALAYAAHVDGSAAAQSAGRSAVVTSRGAASTARRPAETLAISRPGKPGERLNDPWLRGVMLAPSVQTSLTSTTIGDADVRALTTFMQKPGSTVVMNFSNDPHLGMTTETFAGSAVVFQATVTFNIRTAALQ